MTLPLALASPLQVVTGLSAVVVALLTQLGDLWLLFSLVALVYWLDVAAPWVGHGLDRERAALVVALLAGAIALLVATKPIFAVSRPPGFDVAPTAEWLPMAVEPVYAWMATADGYSFPSGHALGSTIVYGALAWEIRAGRLRTRAAVAAVVVAIVAATRVLLGVHYPLDVVAGAAFGLAYLAVVVHWIRDPDHAFAIAALIAVLAVATEGVTVDDAAAVGLAVGLAATWYALGDDLAAAPATRSGALSTAVLGLLTVAPLLTSAIVLHFPTWAAALAGAVGGALLLALPLLGERIGLVLGGRPAQSTSS
jgi:membrane-associated phospholipid phosphatase